MRTRPVESSSSMLTIGGDADFFQAIANGDAAAVQAIATPEFIEALKKSGQSDKLRKMFQQVVEQGHIEIAVCLLRARILHDLTWGHNDVEAFKAAFSYLFNDQQTAPIGIRIEVMKRLFNQACPRDWVGMLQCLLTSAPRQLQLHSAILQETIPHHVELVNGRDDTVLEAVRQESPLILNILTRDLNNSEKLSVYKKVLFKREYDTIDKLLIHLPLSDAAFCELFAICISLPFDKENRFAEQWLWGIKKDTFIENRMDVASKIFELYKEWVPSIDKENDSSTLFYFKNEHRKNGLAKILDYFNQEERTVLFEKAVRCRNLPMVQLLLGERDEKKSLHETSIQNALSFLATDRIEASGVFEDLFSHASHRQFLSTNFKRQIQYDRVFSSSRSVESSFKTDISFMSGGDESEITGKSNFEKNSLGLDEVIKLHSDDPELFRTALKRALLNEDVPFARSLVMFAKTENRQLSAIALFTIEAILEEALLNSKNSASDHQATQNLLHLFLPNQPLFLEIGEDSWRTLMTAMLQDFVNEGLLAPIEVLRQSGVPIPNRSIHAAICCALRHYGSEVHLNIALSLLSDSFLRNLSRFSAKDIKALTLAFARAGHVESVRRILQATPTEKGAQDAWNSSIEMAHSQQNQTMVDLLQQLHLAGSDASSSS